MGYNQLNGIELPDETDGLIPDPTWKRINQGENWSTGDTYIAGVGQGFMIASPLQVLLSAATVANDGKLMLCESSGHSITRSAPTSTDWGISSPSVLAVFMLMTSSNRVGRSNGKSRGLAPLRILSTK